MNSTTVVLRRKPFFLIKVEEYTFEIKNEEDKNNDGKYEFDQIASFELQNKHVNWIVTTLSYIIDFIGGPSGQIYKEKNLFKFYYKNEY
ncbi:hypothetical protein [Pseudofulvibacter geojedonensis]|uniref:Uncharacterized protein n=1 Tax=Pseudofulvibacter geojedonensis TaxID=1123758 RepID=A0ABW3I0R3_9FLAO